MSDFHGEDHFMTRIGVGGIINVEKIHQAHRVLDDIKAFHHHYKCREHALAQVAINSKEVRYAQYVCFFISVLVSVATSHVREGQRNLVFACP